MCYNYADKAEYAQQAQQHPGTKAAINPAEDNRKKQCKPYTTEPNPNAIHPRKRHNNPTHSNSGSGVCAFVRTAMAGWLHGV